MIGRAADSIGMTRTQFEQIVDKIYSWFFLKKKEIVLKKNQKLEYFS